MIGRYALWENIIPKEFPKPHELTGELKAAATNLDEELFGDEIKEEKQKESQKKEDFEDADDLFEERPSRDPLDIIDADDLSDPEREEMKASKRVDASTKAELLLFGTPKKRGMLDFFNLLLTNSSTSILWS